MQFWSYWKLYLLTSGRSSSAVVENKTDQMARSFTFLCFCMYGSVHLEYLVCISIQKEKYIAPVSSQVSVPSEWCPLSLCWVSCPCYIFLWHLVLTPIIEIITQCCNYCLPSFPPSKLGTPKSECVLVIIVFTSVKSWQVHNRCSVVVERMDGRRT